MDEVDKLEEALERIQASIEESNEVVRNMHYQLAVVRDGMLTDAEIAAKLDVMEDD